MTNKLRTEEMDVTPEFAARTLDALAAAVQAGKIRQRNITEGKVLAYADDMRLGSWLLTHQGLGFNKEGICIDGQHRLAAVIRYGKPVRMLVTYGLTRGDDSIVEPMDVIDRGKARSVANMLQLHGYRNSTTLAATMVAAARVFTGHARTQLTMVQTQHMLNLFHHGAEQMFNMFGDAKTRPNAPVLGPLVVYHEAKPMKARAFAQAMINMTNLQAGSPVLALIKYRQQNAMLAGGGRQAQYHNMLITCVCLQRYDENEPVTVLRANEEARGWLAGVDKAVAKEVLKLFRPPTDRPAQPSED